MKFKNIGDMLGIWCEHIENLLAHPMAHINMLFLKS